MHRHVVSVQSGEQHRVYWRGAGAEAARNGVVVSVHEGYGGGAGGVWVLGWAEGEWWEALEGEGTGAGGEGDDELGGQTVNLVEVEGGVEGFWEGRFAEGSTDVGGVTGFDRQD